MENEIKDNTSDLYSIKETKDYKKIDKYPERKNVPILELPIVNNEKNIIEREHQEEKRIITQEIIKIINTDKYKKYKGENENTLSKLIINDIKNFSEYKILKIKKIFFENISNENFNDLLGESSYILKKFKKYDADIDLEEIKFKNCDIDINFSNTFPMIKVIKIINCPLPFNLHNNLNFNFLTHLILENVGLINENFEYLFFKIRDNDNLRKNLKVISFKNNNIGMLDLCKGIPDNL